MDAAEQAALAKRLLTVKSKLTRQVNSGGYFKKRALGIPALVFVGALITLIAHIVFALGLAADSTYDVSAVPVLLGLPYLVTYWIILSKRVMTAKGVEVDVHLKGMRMYIELAEKDRLAFLQGMPDNPLLESLLGEKLPQVTEDSNWSEIVRALEFGEIGCVAVVDLSSKYLGIITDHDVRVYISRGNQIADCKAGAICNRSSFTAAPDEDFWSFMLRMQKNKAMHTVVPLVSASGHLVGILKTQDALFRKTSQGRN
jgi:CBS domain-containing protein